MKSICIIGAGPGGLVTAKVLLATHRSSQATQPIKITILEKQDRIGGMWALNRNDVGHIAGQKCGPNLRVNLSRFTVQFSDFSYRDALPAATSAEIVLAGKKLASSGCSPPMFPYAWQVGDYLNTYAKRFVPMDSIHLSCEVTSATKITDDHDERWRVQWIEGGSRNGDVEPEQKEGVFDHLVITSGFFNQPQPLDIPLPENVTSTDGTNTPPRIIHSSEFRTIQDLVPDSTHAKPTKIVVIGGSLSGSETAAAVAQQISNARHAPENDASFDDCKVHHIFSKPFYALPMYLPQDAPVNEAGEPNHAPTFLPIDLLFHDLSKRPPGELQPALGYIPPEQAKMRHKGMQTSIGGDQSDLGRPELVFKESEHTIPPVLGITDQYAAFIHDGSIMPTLGRATRIRHGDNNTLSVEVSKGSDNDNESAGSHEIKDVAAIIYATGYSPSPAFAIFDTSTLTSMSYNASTRRLPVLLHSCQNFPQAIPNLAFVGMYEGPFWGVMEMQARQIASAWLLSAPPPSSSDIEPELEEMRALRKAMAANDSSVPQFWTGDYPGMMEALARRLDITRVGGQDKPCIPSRYPGPDTDRSVASSIVSDMESILVESTTKARFVAAAAFRGMQGIWHLNRTLKSSLPEFPLKGFKGTASFHPRNPTDIAYAAEYLYIESGTAETHTGQTFAASRRYVYRYSSDRDQISAWFVKEDGRTVDYLFNEMVFDPESDKREGWTARGDHLCIKDMYDSTSTFKFVGSRVDEFSIRYDVKGPSKDYRSETRFERARPKHLDNDF